MFLLVYINIFSRKSAQAQGSPLVGGPLALGPWRVGTRRVQVRLGKGTSLRAKSARGYVDKGLVAARNQFDVGLSSYPSPLAVLSPVPFGGFGLLGVSKFGFSLPGVLQSAILVSWGAQAWILASWGTPMRGFWLAGAARGGFSLPGVHQRGALSSRDA